MAEEKNVPASGGANSYTKRSPGAIGGRTTSGTPSMGLCSRIGAMKGSCPRAGVLDRDVAGWRYSSLRRAGSSPALAEGVGFEPSGPEVRALRFLDVRLAETYGYGSGARTLPAVRALPGRAP